MRLLSKLLVSTLFTLSSLSANSGVLDITWPIPNAKLQKPTVPYPSTLSNGIINTKLPVYVPSSYAYDKNMMVVSNNNFYTISFLLNGAMVMISGDKTFQESITGGNSEFNAIMKSTAPVEFIEAEGLMSAEFNRHKVNYSMSIECDNPKKDSRCTEETFIKNLYNQLIMVGGHP